MTPQFDVIIVGAGMLGLAHAYHAARRKLKVLVVERNDEARGASVRNFGMLATIVQGSGPDLERGLRTRQHWQDIADQSGIQLLQCGCLFAAKTPEEMRVLRSFAEMARSTDRDVQFIDAPQMCDYAPAVRADALQGGLWAPEVCKVDQRSAMAKLAAWLQAVHQVDFLYNSEVQAISSPVVETSNGKYRADQIIVCGGDEFETLFPDVIATTGVTRCRLQMLRTVPQPDGWRLGPFVLGGLSVARYEGFQDCDGIAELKSQLADQYPDHLEHGIHVIACQEADGSVTIGDSHHYGSDVVSPEQSLEVDRLIEEYLAERVILANPAIAEKWAGSYASLKDTDQLTLQPQTGVTLVTMTNGQGMTHGLGVAEDTISAVFGDA